MKTRAFWIGLIVALLLVVGLAACGNDDDKDDKNDDSESTPTTTDSESTDSESSDSAEAEQPESDLLRLLRFVPDTPTYREQLIIYGDLAAATVSWDVPRIRSAEELEDSSESSRWITMSSQAFTGVLGEEYLMVDSEFQREFYGFALFDVDRHLAADARPDQIVVVESDVDPATIAETLTASGYDAESLAGGGTLYSILDDYEIPMEIEMEVPRVGRMGERNRIALLDGQIIIARATPPITAALDAQRGEIPSLADNPAYAAAALALDDPVLADTGDLLNVILYEGFQEGWSPCQMIMGERATGEICAKLAAEFGDMPELPPYDLLAFAIRHGEGDSFRTPGVSYGILAIVFPAGTEAQAAAAIVVDRLAQMDSLRYGRPYSDLLLVDRALGVTANGLPVALIVVREEDPPVPATGEPMGRAFSWRDFVLGRDIGFLYTGSFEE